MVRVNENKKDVKAWIEYIRLQDEVNFSNQSLRIEKQLSIIESAL